MSVDEYEATFGSITEDEGKMEILLSLFARTVESAKRKAVQSGMTLSTYIESKL